MSYLFTAKRENLYYMLFALEIWNHLHYKVKTYSFIVLNENKIELH